MAMVQVIKNKFLINLILLNCWRWKIYFIKKNQKHLSKLLIKKSPIHQLCKTDQIIQVFRVLKIIRVFKTILIKYNNQICKYHHKHLVKQIFFNP